MTISSDIVSWLLDQARAQGADAADAVMLESVEMNLSRRLGKPENIERSESMAVGLRAFYQGRQAIASSTDMGQDALNILAERTVAMAKAAPADLDSTLAPQSLHPTFIPDLELFDPQEPSPEWMAEQCAQAEDTALAVKGITNSEGADAHYAKHHTTLGIWHPDGQRFLRSYPSSHLSVSVSVLAGNGTGMERDYDFSSAHWREDVKDAASIGKEAAKRALKRLNPRKVMSCQVPVIFDPRVSKTMLSILAGAISGSAVARGSSFLKDALHSAIFAPHVTIIDDPHRIRGLASKPFDGEGVENKKSTLVQKGELTSWLLDMRTANKLKLTTTGHASRGLASPPSPAATNLYMENGTLSPKELMSDIKSGLYVTETFGMGINIVTGDYSQGAAGFWIENGEIAYPVSEITIAGQLRGMFASLTPANDLAFRYAVNAPTLRIDCMTIAGS